MRLLLKHRFDCLALAPQVRAPLLVLVAEKDWVIPPRHERRLFDVWPAPKRWRLLPGVDHDSISSVEVCWDDIADFLRSVR